jgi:hypothetical protein
MIVLSFKPRLNPSRSISATINIEAGLRGATPGRVIAINRDEVIREFNVSYIVVPRISRVQPDGLIPLKPQSLPAYNHLLGDPTLKVVYVNSNVIILQVVESPDR